MASLHDGAVVHLTSIASGKNLKCGPQGDVSGKGGLGKWAKWVVHAAGGQVRLQRFVGGGFYRLGKMGKCDAAGGQGKWTAFSVHEHGLGKVTLKGLGGIVGVNNGGWAKNGRKSGKGPHGQFFVSSVHVQPGHRVYLTNVASGQSLAIKPTGKVTGNGGKGKFAKFIIESAGRPNPAIVKIKQTWNGKYINMTGKGPGVGGGGKWCDFQAIPLAGKRVALKSVHTGTLLGIRRDGFVAPHHKVGLGKRGQFIVHQF